MRPAKTKYQTKIKVDDSLIKTLAPKVLHSLRQLNVIENAVDKFLLQYPHYRKLRVCLKSECELACAACAIAASCLGLCRPDGKRIFGDCSAPRCSLGIPGKQKLVPPRIHPGLIGRVQSYMALFEYMTGRSSLVFSNNERLLSALSAIAYSTASQAVERNCRNNVMHQDICQLSQELYLPVLSSTFSHFVEQ
ncbi:MAG: hypothetical protein AAGU11_19930 [Syntrophobacteraceae bacterium]